MKQYKYIRSSHHTQNNAYQKDDRFEMYIDVCSGIIPFANRKGGSELLQILQPNDYLAVESLDRLGRDSLDCLNTLSVLKERKVNVELLNLGLSSLLENGRPNPAFEIVSSVLSVISEQTRNNILEAQKRGVAVARAQNKYKGRKVGSIIPRSIYLERNAETVKIIKKHPSLSLRELAKLSGVSHVKVKKIKAML